MKIWCYNDPVYNGDQLVGNILREVNEDQILSEYWDFWSKQMELKYGENHYMINTQTCIEDWVTNNWAWEKK
jgi:hypothetical protein